ncbi:MAG: molybdate ABC transporter substrate-binding protein, partial [Planctomycetota bacterium]
MNVLPGKRSWSRQASGDQPRSWSRQASGTCTATGRKSSQRSRRGSSSGILLIVISLLILIGAIALLISPTKSQSDNEATSKLRLYCAAGIKPVVNDAIAAYQAEMGTRIEVQYGGSGTLLSQLEVRPEGVDLYLAADSSYLETARSKGLIRETLTLAKLLPVIAVASGNPKNVTTAASLADNNVKLGLANPDAAAVGRIAKKVFSGMGEWDAIKANCKVFKPTVNEIANDVAIGSIDAAIVWDSTVAMFDNLQAVELPEFESATRTVTIGVTETTKNSVEALRFARFLSSQDRGKPLFEKHGFRTVQGDRWEPSPELVLFAGSIFNQAIEDTIKSFEAREGVTVSRVYNGCGILVGQMRAGAAPDAYLSCDQSFMTRVGELFDSPTDISENRLVLIAAAANPQKIATLADLARPNLKVGLAHPEKSALGHLTEKMLIETKQLEPLKQSGNWKQDAPQG